MCFFRFYCKNNGVLYENETIQIGVKTECRGNLARLAIFYGNKTSFPFLVSHHIHRNRVSRQVLFGYKLTKKCELCLHFGWTKVHYICQNWSILAIYWNPEACCQTVLPDCHFWLDKNWWKSRNWKFSMRHFDWFLNFCFKNTYSKKIWYFL